MRVTSSVYVPGKVGFNSTAHSHFPFTAEAAFTSSTAPTACDIQVCGIYAIWYSFLFSIDRDARSEAGRVMPRYMPCCAIPLARQRWNLWRYTLEGILLPPFRRQFFRALIFFHKFERKKCWVPRIQPTGFQTHRFHHGAHGHVITYQQDGGYIPNTPPYILSSPDK